MNKCKCEKTLDSMRMDISRNASWQWMCFTCKFMWLPESWLSTLLWSALGYKRVDYWGSGVRLSLAGDPEWCTKMAVQSPQLCYPVGAGCQICWGLVLAAWIPWHWCCFPLCRTKITHCIYWLVLTLSAFLTPKLFTLFLVRLIFLDSWRATFSWLQWQHLECYKWLS